MEWCDFMHENNDDLHNWFFNFIHWDHGDEIRDEYDELIDEPVSEYDCAWNAWNIIDSEPFFESVGVNHEEGYVGFICKPCNSHRRFELLQQLGDVAVDLDGISGNWFLFATFWDRSRQVGIDLRRLGLPETKNNEHVFDVSELTCGNTHVAAQ